MLCYSDATRQTHHGPSVIEIGTDGLVVTEPAAIPPVVEELPLALEPVAVTGRTDIRGATMYTRGDGDNCLEQAYPVETTVMPGALQCEWVVSGLAGEVTVTLADDDYQVVDTQVLAAETEGAELAVDAGKHYYWRIWHPDIATSYAGFTVLDDGSRDAVAAVLASMGAEALGTGDAIAQVRDAADLTCLLSVFQYYGLQREMQATLTQLKAVLLED